VEDDGARSDLRENLNRGGGEERKPTVVVWVVDTRFPIDALSTEVLLVFQKKNPGALRTFACFPETNPLRTCTDLNVEPFSDRLESVFSVANWLVQREYDRGLRSCPALERGHTADGFTKPSSSDIWPIFGGEMNDMSLAPGVGSKSSRPLRIVSAGYLGLYHDQIPVRGSISCSLGVA
jgi:hypothetical protein